jgi:hypothetical protein
MLRAVLLVLALAVSGFAQRESIPGRKLTRVPGDLEVKGDAEIGAKPSTVFTPRGLAIATGGWVANSLTMPMPVLLLQNKGEVAGSNDY